MPKRLRTPVLFVHHRSELGGAPASLSYLIRELDDTQFEAHIYCPPGPAAELFRQQGAKVPTGPVAGFTHIWASTYRGRRWLLFLRELGLLPPHVLRFRRTLRRHRFELVHFNDSPLIPAAWLARRESLPVVWHLRSALPDGGGDRRSELVRSAIRELPDRGRRRPRPGVLPDRGRPEPPARRPHPRLRVRGEPPRRRARPLRRRPLHPVHAGHGGAVPGLRRRGRALAGPGARTTRD